jgi:hypothetical protein
MSQGDQGDDDVPEERSRKLGAAAISMSKEDVEDLTNV